MATSGQAGSPSVHAQAAATRRPVREAAPSAGTLACGGRRPLPRDPRVRLAAQRTFLAWVRTAVALLALGLVLAKFSLFLRRLDPHLPLRATNRLSLVLVVAAGVLDLLAGVAFLRHPGGRGLAALVVAVVAGAAGYAALYIVPR